MAGCDFRWRPRVVSREVVLKMAQVSLDRPGYRSDGRVRHRRLPVGAEVVADKGVDFRVWAPDRARVEVVLEEGPGVEVPGQIRAIELAREPGGYFSGLMVSAGPGTLYRYRLDSGE